MSRPARQASESVAQNSDFFSRDTYGRHADRLDSHERIRTELTAELAGTRRLLDVGNGGVFEYDPAVAEEIVAIDLFLDRKPGGQHPDHVTLRRGDALALEEAPGSYDVVLQAFLYHHLTGVRPEDSIANTRRAIAEAARVLSPGGSLVIAESCIPRALWALERALYRPLRAVAARTPLTGGHPATLQLPIGVIHDLVAEQLEVVRCRRIRLGRWLTQFGRPWPTALTPVRAFLIVGRKPG